MNNDDKLKFSDIYIDTVGKSSVVSATGTVSTTTPSWATNSTTTGPVISTIGPAITTAPFTTAGAGISTISWLDSSSLAVSDEKVLTDIICICSEDILTTILDRLQERNIAAAKSFIEKILDRRHLTEKFILDFIDLIDDKDDILQHHRAEILSGEYPSLALLFELNK